MSAQEFHPRSRESDGLPLKQAVARHDSCADAGKPAEAGTATLAHSAGNAAISRVLNQEAMGSSLEPGFRRQMEQALGADFSRVRVRDDSAARSTADAMDANAFTRGDEIFLGHDAPSVGEPGGKRLLAHELTHVVQQRRAATLIPGINSPGDAFEQEAGRVSQRALQGQPAALSAGGSPAGVQRDDKNKPPEKSGAPRNEVLQALEDFLKRALEAQGGHGLRMTEAVKAAIRMLANAEDPNWKGPGGDPQRPARSVAIEGLLTAGLGDPVELATRVANRLPDPFDRSALEHLKTMPVDDGEPSSKAERVKALVEKSAPGDPERHDDPQKTAPDKKLEQDIATSRAMRGQPQPSGVGPVSIDLLRVFRIGQALPSALNTPKKRSSTEPAKPVDIEATIQKIPEDALVPAEARGRAQAESYAEAREVARFLAQELDQAQQQGRESIQLRLGANYNEVQDRRAMITAVENLIQTVREALPHHATAVQYVDVHFGDRLVSRGVQRTSQ